MRSGGTCQKVAGALTLTSRVTANPESSGSGKVININIKTSNENQVNDTESVHLRALQRSASNTGEAETCLPAASTPLAPTFNQINLRCKIDLLFREGRCCMSVHLVPVAAFVAPLFGFGLLSYLY